MSANVLAIGGTTLPLDSNGNRIAAETARSLSCDGVSAYEAELAWQKTFGIQTAKGTKSLPDVSFDADPDTGVAVYCLFSRYEPYV